MTTPPGVQLSNPPPLPNTAAHPGPAPSPATVAEMDAWNVRPALDLIAKAQSVFAFLDRHPEVKAVWIAESQAKSLQV